MKNKLKWNNRGQGLIEYLIIVAIMAVATMSILRVMNQTVQAKFAKVTQSLQGNGAPVHVRYENVSEEHFKKRDMGDFFKGTQSSGTSDQ